MNIWYFVSKRRWPTTPWHSCLMTWWTHVFCQRNAQEKTQSMQLHQCTDCGNVFDSTKLGRANKNLETCPSCHVATHNCTSNIVSCSLHDHFSKDLILFAKCPIAGCDNVLKKFCTCCAQWLSVQNISKHKKKKNRIGKAQHNEVVIMPAHEYISIELEPQETFAFLDLLMRNKWGGASDCVFMVPLSNNTVTSKAIFSLHTKLVVVKKSKYTNNDKVKHLPQQHVPVHERMRHSNKKKRCSSLASSFTTQAKTYSTTLIIYNPWRLPSVQACHKMKMRIR